MSDRDIPGSTPPGDGGQEPSIGDELEEYLAKREEEINSEENKPTPEELKEEKLIDQMRQRLIEALKKNNLKFDFEEDLDSQNFKIDIDIDKIRANWDRLTAIVSTLKEHELVKLNEANNEYDQMEAELSKLYREAEVIYFLFVLASSLKSFEEGDEFNELEYYVTQMTDSEHLDSQDKRAFTDALESIIGKEKVDEILKEIEDNSPKEDGIEDPRNIGEVNNQIIEMLVDEFRLDEKINHDDFDLFIQKILQYKRLQESGAPEEILNIGKESIKQIASRLGISESEIHSIFRNIENIEDSE